MTSDEILKQEYPDNFNDLPEDERRGYIDRTLRLLHVYGQDMQHDDVEIVGNRHALEVLRSVVDAALVGGSASSEAMASDGEGFMIGVRLDDSQWESPAWETRELPYADPIARGKRDQIWLYKDAVCELKRALRLANTALVKRGVKPIPMPDMPDGI